MSADLFVQSPYSSQSFNRYTYVSNNPLSNVDPSGYSCVNSGVRNFSDTYVGDTRVSHEYTGNTILGTECTGGSHDSGADAIGDANNIASSIAPQKLDLGFRQDGNYDTISPLEGNPYIGLFQAAVEDATFGVVFGKTSSISLLHSNPQITANKEAARKVFSLTLNGVAFAGMVVNPGKGAVHSHHLIPNAVYKDLGRYLDPKYYQHHVKNLANLPTPFHGYHPSYSAYVRETLKDMITTGRTDLKDLERLQNQLRQEVTDIYDKGYIRLNDYYKELGYKW